MSELYFGTDLFSEFDRLQRQMASLFGGLPSSIRSGRSGAFPQVNIGSTDDSIEIVAFAPGVDPKKLDVSIDKGLLSISGERENAQPQAVGEDTRTFMRRSGSSALSGASSNCRSTRTPTRSRRSTPTAA